MCATCLNTGCVNILPQPCKLIIYVFVKPGVILYDKWYYRLVNIILNFVNFKSIDTCIYYTCIATPT